MINLAFKQKKIREVSPGFFENMKSISATTVSLLIVIIIVIVFCLV